MLLVVVAVDQDIIEIDHNVDIKQVCKEGVQEALKSGWCVRQTFQYDLEVVQAVAGVESGFVLVASSDTE